MAMGAVYPLWESNHCARQSRRGKDHLYHVVAVAQAVVAYAQDILVELGVINTGADDDDVIGGEVGIGGPCYPVWRSAGIRGCDDSPV